MGSGSNGVYNKLAGEFHGLMSDPFSLTGNEDFSLAGELPDVSFDGVENRAQGLKSFSSRLGGVLQDSQTANLPFDQRLDLELARDWSEAVYLEDMATVDGSPQHAVKPDAIQGFVDQISVVLDRDPRSKDVVIGDLISRLRGLGNYLDAGLERLDRPVDVWTRLEIDAGKGFVEAADGIRKYADELGYQNMSRLNTALTWAEFNVARYLARLQAMPTRTELSIGPEATEQLFRSKGILLDLRKIHSMAMDHLAGLNEEIAPLRAKLVEKYGLDVNMTVQQVADFLKTKYQSPKGRTVEFAREICRRAEEFAYGSGLIEKMNNSSVEVRRTPSYLEPGVPIAAVCTPGAFCTGVRKSVFFITEFDGVEWDLNQLNLSSTGPHELIPGHAYQLTRATEHPSLVRAWVHPMDLAEGWTTRVAEQEMIAKGFRGNPELIMEERYEALTDERRLPSRVCFVSAMHTGDRSYFNNSFGISVTSPDLLDAATELYKGMTGFSDKRARRDVELFSSLGTYGALYLVGNVLFRQMEDRAKQRQGASFKLPDFWEAILQEGNMPLSYVERALQYKGVL